MRRVGVSIGLLIGLALNITCGHLFAKSQAPDPPGLIEQQRQPAAAPEPATGLTAGPAAEIMRDEPRERDLATAEDLSDQALDLRIMIDELNRRASFLNRTLGEELKIIRFHYEAENALLKQQVLRTQMLIEGLSRARATSVREYRDKIGSDPERAELLAGEVSELEDEIESLNERAGLLLSSQVSLLDESLLAQADTLDTARRIQVSLASQAAGARSQLAGLQKQLAVREAACECPKAPAKGVTAGPGPASVQAARGR